MLGVHLSQRRHLVNRREYDARLGSGSYRGSPEAAAGIPPPYGT
jgi:hypothetical protein